jgi:6,7-dimethyl-8-ribityllumazine synthase
MSQDKVKYAAKLSAQGLRIGIVHARFNATVVDAMVRGCVKELKALGAAKVVKQSVPGALEIPLVLQVMAESGQFDALVAIGCVIRGETYHFEVVCNESCRGVSEVQEDSGVPIANAILTVENDAQAKARIPKGAEAARVAVEMAHTVRALNKKFSAGAK